MAANISRHIAPIVPERRIAKQLPEVNEPRRVILYTSNMRIELACTACGQNRFSFPRVGADQDPVLCEDCGNVVGTLGELKEKVQKQIVAARS